MKTYLEYVDDKSRKFWEIAVERNFLKVRFGKIDFEGTLHAKYFETEELARQHAEKMINEKIKKGYRHVLPSRSTDALQPSSS